MDTINKQHLNIFGGLVGRAELLLLVLVLPFLFTGGQAVKGSYVVAGVKSHVSLAYGKDVYEFDTYKTELIDAVNEQGIETYDQDLFSIPRETKLSGQTLKVNVTKSLPVVINDEGKHTVGRTVFSKPEKILEQNNIKYWPEDILSTELITDPVTTGAVGQLVNVKRAPVYTILVDGKKKEVRTWETKVGTIIEKSATKINPNDIVKPSLKSSVISGASIKITRINYAKITETKTIDYGTSYQYNYFLASGSQKVLRSGALGEKSLTYNITYKNGEEVSRTLIGSKIIKNPTTETIEKGIMPLGDPDFNRTYWGYMVAAGQKYGVRPIELFEVASCESHLNPLSTGGGGTYLGMYQYTSSFWKSASAAAGYAGVSWTNAKAQIYSTARYASIYGWGKWGGCAL